MNDLSANQAPIILSGAPGSPYTRKMLAVLRYRRIPYKYLVDNKLKIGLPQAKPALLPTFYFPGEDGFTKAFTDSTPLIKRLETMYRDREVKPTSPVINMLDNLLEDYCDEWLTKPMFHYRWAFASDIDRASRIVPLPMNIQINDGTLASVAQAFGQRQVSRLHVVGSNVETAELIEGSYLRLLDILEQHFTLHPYLMGKRPGASDFALYGQLSQLALFDPTPMAIACRQAPRVVAWTQLTEDLSGLEPKDNEWIESHVLPNTLKSLLIEAGRTYVPVMLANEKAIKEGSQAVVTIVDGQKWSQQAFPYQSKCLRWLREDFNALTSNEQGHFMHIIKDTGCEALFTQES